MAETQIIPNSSLPIAPNSSADVLSSEAVGQKQDASGNFGAHLDESIKEISNIDSGESLPVDGKVLPQVIGDLKSKLLSLTQQFNLDDIDSNLLDTQADLLEDIVDTELLDVNQLPELLPNLYDLKDALSLPDSVESLANSELPVVNEIATQIIQNIDALPIETAETNSSIVNPTHVNLTPVNPVQVSALASSNSTIDSQTVSNTVTPSIEIEVQKNLLNSTTVTDKPIDYSASQNIDIGEDTSTELNDFIAKYLSDDNASKTILKNQIVDGDVFQQNINSLKADATVQNINTGSILDSYTNINATNVQNKAIETPIPLLIKQGIASEQVQQSVDQSIAQNVKWLIGNKAQNARINVFPESLGQVNIALNLEDSNLKLNFIAANNVTKDLIEASIASLRNHFDEIGIDLQEVNVETRFSDQAKGEPEFADLHGEEGQSNSNNHSSFSVNDRDDLLPPGIMVSAPLYLLDAYA